MHLGQAQGWLPSLVPVRNHLAPLCPVSQTGGAVGQQQRGFLGLGEGFSSSLFSFGPLYDARRNAGPQQVNVISGTAKLFIWKTRKVRGQRTWGS